MSQYPTSDDRLVAALQRLLERKGGHVYVGRAADINDQSLYQIATRKPDSKTGKPKGVGPSIRKRLDRAFPGWLDAPPSAPSTSRPSLEEALRVVVEAITESPPARWPSVRAQLDQVAAHPQRIDEVLAELHELLRRRDGPAKPARAA